MLKGEAMKKSKSLKKGMRKNGKMYFVFFFSFNLYNLRKAIKMANTKYVNPISEVLSTKRSPKSTLTQNSELDSKLNFKKKTQNLNEISQSSIKKTFPTKGFIISK